MLEIVQQALLGTGVEYIWEEVPKLSNISSEDTGVFSEDSKEKIIKKKYDWTNLYGKLENGEYEFILSASQFTIRIGFNINTNGKISYNNPELLQKMLMNLIVIKNMQKNKKIIDENIGFINDLGLDGTDGENKGFLVTTNGGKTFNDANIINPYNIEEKNLLVKGVPYIEDGKLKVVIYTLNHSKSSEKTYYEFVSNDNGVTWEFYKNK